MAKKCRVHDWRMPVVGDAGLTCDACGRHLDFMQEVTPNILASIGRARERHYGDIPGYDFGQALLAAYIDAVARHRAERERELARMIEG